MIAGHPRPFARPKSPARNASAGQNESPTARTAKAALKSEAKHSAGHRRCCRCRGC
jgi:hypothetical protein